MDDSHRKDVPSLNQTNPGELLEALVPKATHSLNCALSRLPIYYFMRRKERDRDLTRYADVVDTDAALTTSRLSFLKLRYVLVVRRP